jgi:hypothetical protein
VETAAPRDAAISPHQIRGDTMTIITDEQMAAALATSRDYSILVLRAGPNWNMEGVRAIVTEHGRRNLSLRADRLLPIVCRVTDDSDLAGIGVFNAPPDEVRRIMEEDPGVKAGVFVYDIHPCMSFPGDSLPG